MVAYRPIVMVSPHRDWDDVEAGYVREDCGVFVEPAVVRFGDGLSTHLVGAAADEAEVYSVSIRVGLGSTAESWLPVAHFVALRPAWEFAHLLTRFVSAAASPTAATSALRQRTGAIPDVVTEESAAELFDRVCDSTDAPMGTDALASDLVPGEG